MKSYKYFYVQYDPYVVFTPDGKENPVTRRLYKNTDGTYYFTYNKERVKVEEHQLYR